MRHRLAIAVGAAFAIAVAAQAARPGQLRAVRPHSPASGVYTDDPLVARVTPVRRIHLTELRLAVNDIRRAAGLADASWSEAAPTLVRAVQVVELRSALAEALPRLGRSVPPWSEPLAARTPIRAVHLQEIRDATRWGPSDRGGTLAGDTTWLPESSPYLVRSDVVVPAGVTLTVRPGTVVKFHPGTSLIIEAGGTLLADGTTDRPIIFTSWRDDAAGGDTNGDGGATFATPGDWLALRFNGAANPSRPAFGSLTNAVVRNGQQLVVRNSAPALRNVTSTRMSGDGLYLEAPSASPYRVAHLTLTANERNLTLVAVPATTTLTDFVIRGAGTYAVQASSNTAALLQYSSIDENRAGAAILADSTSPIVLRYDSITRNRTADGQARGVTASCCVTVDARQNWWGSTSGPEVAGASDPGGGSQINGNVLFDDWLGHEWEGSFKAGDHPWTVKAGVGTDVATGNFFLVETDVSIPAVGFPLEITRTYNNKIAGGTRTEMGTGWSWNYGTRLETHVNDWGVIWDRPDGVQTYFKLNPDFTFSAEEGIYEKLSRDPFSGIYRMTRKDQSMLMFDPGGLLIQLIDAHGNVTELARDASGRLVRVTEVRTNRSFTIAYDGLSISRITDPLGRTFDYARHPNGAISSVTRRDERGAVYAVSTYTYGPDGPWQMTAVDDADGNHLAQSFDAAHQVTSQTFNGNGRVQFVYGPASYAGLFVPAGATGVWDSRGRAHLYYYRGRSNKVTEHQRQDSPAGAPYTFTVDESWIYTGYLTSAYNTADGTTTSLFDWNSGNVTRLTEPGGRVSTYTYDERNNLTSATDPAGFATRYDYDEHQRPVRVVDAAGGETRTTYTSYGLPETVSDPLGHVTRFTYDTGYLASATNGENETTTYTHDLAGRTLSETNALGARTSHTYDGRGNVLTTTDPLNRVTTYAYDAYGRRTRVTDPLGHTTTFAYDDARNLLTRITDARQGSVELGYDTFGGNLVQVKDANGHFTTFTYDELNRKISETDALSRTWTFAYTGRDRIARVTDAAGATTTYSYDAFNQLVRVAYPDGVAALSYDTAGNKIALSDWTGQPSTWSYDALRRITRYSRGGFDIGYAYDAAGNLTDLTYGPGRSVHHTYDAANRLRSVADWQNRTTTYAYDRAGRMTLCAFGNGVQGVWEYDGSGRPVAITYRRNGETLASRDYLYDAAGNRLAARQTNGIFESYTYDELNRLTQVVYANGDRYGYAYDAGGNRVALSVSPVSGLPGTIVYSYDAADQMQSSPGHDRLYDANGAQTIDGSSRGFFWNGQHLLSEAYESGLQATFTYDGDGRRVRTVDRGVTSDFVQNTAGSLPEVLIALPFGSPYYHVYGRDLLYTIEPDGAHYLHPDALGSTILATNDAGGIEGRYEYDVFGLLRSSSYGHPTRRLFTGEETDLTDLLFLRARYDDLLSGRFLSRDPFPANRTDTQSFNRYVYVRNNPVTLTDPSGEIAPIVVLGLAGALAGILSQAVQDVANLHASGWSAYAGAAVGGVVGVVTLAALAPSGPGAMVAARALSGAAADATAELVHQVPALWHGEALDVPAIVREAAYGALMSFVPEVKVKGAPNSLYSTGKGLLTKLASRPPIQNLYALSPLKVFYAQTIHSFVPTMVSGLLRNPAWIYTKSPY